MVLWVWSTFHNFNGRGKQPASQERQHLGVTVLARLKTTRLYERAKNAAGSREYAVLREYPSKPRESFAHSKNSCRVQEKGGRSESPSARARGGRIRHLRVMGSATTSSMYGKAILAGCCGPEEAFHSVELQGAEGAGACSIFLRPPAPSSPPPHLHIPASILLFLVPSLLLRGCRRRGAGLILDHGATASLGTTRGGAYEGGCPRGRPGLSRAPARTPPISEEPLRGAGGWENSLLEVADV